jgi:hypothetical protein
LTQFGVAPAVLGVGCWLVGGWVGEWWWCVQRWTAVKMMVGGWVPLGGCHWVGAIGWVPLGGCHWVGAIGWVGGWV